jgi:hypothetical protein
LPVLSPPPVAAVNLSVSRLECECSETRSPVRHCLFPFADCLAFFLQLSRWALVMLSQLSGWGLGPEGARATACAAPSAAPDSACASAPAAVCAARGPTPPLAIHDAALMLVPLPRPRPAATALTRAVALVSPAAVPPSAVPTAVVAPAATGPFDIHAGRLTSPPRPRPPGGRVGVAVWGIRGGTPPLLGIRAEGLLLL